MLQKPFTHFGLVVLLFVAPIHAAAAGGKKRPNSTAKHSTAWTTHTEDARKKPTPETEGGAMLRHTEGHRPQDLNGDKVISRNEWPGSDDSFRKLDVNGDGVLSNADRALKPRRR